MTSLQAELPPLGATVFDDGTRFSVYSSRAERMELCLFDQQRRQVRCLDLAQGPGDRWQGFVRGVGNGQRYGYRAHGPYRPQDGLRFNAAKLLMDPYARALDGTLRWHDALFDYRPGGRSAGRLPSQEDSAAFMPLSVATAPSAPPAALASRPRWSERIVYEVNLRGYTMQCPGLSAEERGRFRGLTNGAILEHLRALGVSSIELMPVFEFADEEFLVRQGLRNFWGYNTLNFFTPAGRYGGEDPRAEFGEMVHMLHDAGFEVILDVVYNHSAEGGGSGPTLSFRGLDNLSYYRTAADDPAEYINDSGTGNMLDADQLIVQQLVLDSLIYWHRDMGVDGFRFDLAPILGRHPDGFDPQHPLLQAIASEPRLSGVCLIAEPWDPGPGGYQLGQFGRRFAEWNDRYRDSVRRYWRGDDGETGEFALRVSGSPDLLSTAEDVGGNSLNFVTAHDGFTLRDVVSYRRKHNAANGEKNRDGHDHNYSDNLGVEGDTDDPDILRARRHRRLNMLATLLMSRGTPMLLGGDEFGNSQSGNNNAYAQDNETGWIDWSGLDHDPEFFRSVCALVEVRQMSSALLAGDAQSVSWRWLDRSGAAVDPQGADSRIQWSVRGPATELRLLFNPTDGVARFRVEEPDNATWSLRFSSSSQSRPLSDGRWELAPGSIACLGAQPA